MLSNQHKDTIVALATSAGNSGAIAVIRISGLDAISLTNQVFKGKDLTQQASHTLHFGRIYDGDELLDEVLVSLFVAPNSYTKENSVEISTHNSSYIIDRIIQLLIKKGARAALPGEFTMRAFLNGALDLSQAEAVADVIAAENSASHAVAINQMRGGISSKLKQMREELINFTALLELELDFSEEDVEFADRTAFLNLIVNIKKHIQELIQSFAYGNAIKNGVPVAIIGKPNAGKSTLLNALLEDDRAIVSDIAGTTRDTIEETLIIDGICFRFIDTAGLRETADTIEAIGVEKAKEKVKQAKILLYLYDQLDNSPEEVIAQIKSLYFEGLNVVLVHNKMDLAGEGVAKSFDEKIQTALYPDYSSNLINLSAHDLGAVASLKNMLVSIIQDLKVENQQVITNTRHLDALNKALMALEEVNIGLQMQLSGDLLSSHVRDALRHISSITGEIEIDRDILGTIFGKFCIGK